MKKAFQHWQKYWWRYALSLGLLAGIVVAVSCVVYPPLIPLVVSLAVINGTAILSFLTALPVAAAVSAVAGGAAIALASAFMVVRAVTGFFETLVLSVINCFKPKSNIAHEHERVRQETVVLAEVSGQSLTAQKAEINKLISQYNQLREEVIAAFNEDNPNYAVKEMSPFEEFSAIDTGTLTYDEGAQKLREIRANYQALNKAWQEKTIVASLSHKGHEGRNRASSSSSYASNSRDTNPFFESRNPFDSLTGSSDDTLGLH